MLKVLEGNYVDKPQRFTRQEKKPNWMQPSMNYEEDHLASTYALFKDDPQFEEQAAAMRKMLQEKYGRKEEGKAFCKDIDSDGVRSGYYGSVGVQKILYLSYLSKGTRLY
jgi:hypothetical protein